MWTVIFLVLVYCVQACWAMMVAEEHQLELPSETKKLIFYTLFPYVLFKVWEKKVNESK